MKETWSVMSVPKCLVVHVVGKKWKPKKNRSIAEAVKANVTRNAYWIKSWFVPGEGKLYCEWDAKNAESIRQVLAKTPTSSRRNLSNRRNSILSRPVQRFDRTSTL